MITYQDLIEKEADGDKACPCCVQLKSLDAFNKNTTGRKNRQGPCRQCQNANVRKMRRRRLSSSTQKWLKLRDQEKPTTKVCKRCLKMKPLVEFHTVKDLSRCRKGVNTYCKSCFNELHVIWRKEKQYGLTQVDFEEMLQRQGNKCAICGTSDPGGHANVFSIDHCHCHGHVRALLCTLCNTGLGHFQDDPNLLRKAAEYLEAHDNG